MDGVVGNSSSGLLEVPSFKIGTINIGDRQCGRIKAESVIDCEPSLDGIRSAFAKLYSKSFQDQLKRVVSPYGEGGVAEKIVEVIGAYSTEGILKKKFCDLNL